MKAWTKWMITSLALLLAAGSAQAALVAYEDFDYVGGANLTLVTNNNGTGWVDAWQTTWAHFQAIRNAYQWVDIVNIPITADRQVSPLAVDCTGIHQCRCSFLSKVRDCPIMVKGKAATHLKISSHIKRFKARKV